jgi:hypothetical protein
MSKDEIINTIKDYLYKSENTKSNLQIQMDTIIELFDYIITIPSFLKENDNFLNTVIKKLDEFKNHHILNNINDNRINNREFIFYKFEKYSKYFDNIKKPINPIKIII